MRILAIESSCDETAASVLSANKNQKPKILSNVISSQIAIHAQYGGVIPEIAAREHVLNIIPVIAAALANAKTKPSQLDAIAVTKGPGLITSLISGMETARTLAYAWNKPLLGLNHIEGHIYAAFLNLKRKVQFPAIVLTVSGGHTLLAVMKEHGELKIIGDTRDDAAGEAFDKGAKMLGLPYPGGPAVSRAALSYLSQFSEKPKETLGFPRPMLNSGDFDFSFSGLKTSLLYKLQADKNWAKKIEQYCYEYEEAIFDILIGKTLKAAKKYQAKSIIVSGGVSASSRLRKQFLDKSKIANSKLGVYFPEMSYTTDNAAMIASAAYFRLSRNTKVKPWQKEKVELNLSL
ncbi:MAG: tRNA (adenosine(37)-N6)-threonylcarbamoyltransferase complex transferase subunit TsaD [Candidatus Falkowbacteria bacterium]|nr:tRNA (adenosine(37)-N6)-threonylcarbamoyltransferase complex transferase subunit TsaD [Candidatus Falkowbacteria bacterium]